MRTIQVYSSQGKSGGSFTTEASTLGDITQNLEALNISMDNMRIITGDEVELLGPDSKLPSGDIELFFMQKKSKAGQAKLKLDRSEIYGEIAKAKADGTVDKDFFNLDGKNFTMCGSEPLAKKLASIGVIVTGYSVAEGDNPYKAPVKFSNTEESKVSGKDILKVKKSKELTAQLETEDYSQFGNILSRLQGIAFPTHVQEQRNNAYSILEEIHRVWNTPTKPFNKAAMQKKAESLRSKISGLA